MAKKTVTRRLCKYLPVSIELQTAISMDETGERGARQDNHKVIMPDYEIEDTPEPDADAPKSQSDRAKDALGGGK
jgi:recombination protein RecT